MIIGWNPFHDLEWSRETGLSLGDGISKISGPSDELFQESVDALDRLRKDSLNGLKGKRKEAVGERGVPFHPLAFIGGPDEILT